MSKRVFTHDGDNLVIKFPCVVLFPIIIGAVIALIGYSMTIWHVGLNDGRRDKLTSIARDCDKSYGAFFYHAEDGSIYSFKCSFDIKTEMKPWDK